MDFCTECDNLTEKILKPDGSISLECTSCYHTIDAGPQHTLMFREDLISDNCLEGFTELIQNSSSTPVCVREAVKCTKCGIDYMNMVIVSDNMTVLYTCTCGNKVFPKNAKN